MQATKYRAVFKHANGKKSVFFPVASTKDEAQAKAIEEVNAFLSIPKNKGCGPATLLSLSQFTP